jgi:hypothetical protein
MVRRIVAPDLFVERSLQLHAFAAHDDAPAKIRIYRIGLDP